MWDRFTEIRYKSIEAKRAYKCGYKLAIDAKLQHDKASTKLYIIFYQNIIFELHEVVEFSKKIGLLDLVK